MVETSDWQLLDPLVKTLWRISAVTSGLIMGVVVAVPEFVIARKIESYPKFLFPGFWGLCVAILIVGFGIGFANAKYRNTKFRIGDDDLAFVRGIFWKHQRFINRARVQHVDITTNFIASKLGLTEVSVHVGGSIGAAITISGLRPSEAEEMRRRLLEGSMVRYLEAAEAPPVAVPPVTESPAPAVPPALPNDERA